MGKRRWRLVTGLAVSLLLFGSNVAWASFTKGASASGSYATRTLSKPTLTCTGGLLQGPTLTLGSADEVADTDGTANPFKIANYVIEKTTANTNNFSTLATVGLTPNTYTDTFGGTGQTFKYRIKATIGNWVSPVSDTITSTVTSVLFLGLVTTC